MMMTKERDKTLMFLPTDLGNFEPEDRNRFVDMMRILCVAHQSPAVVAIVETWLMARKTMAAIKVELPSEAMDRIEAICIIGEERMVDKIETKTRVLYIKRSDNGKFWGLNEEMKGMDRFEGRFSKILTPPPVPDEIAAAARKLLSRAGIGFKQIK